MIENFLGFILGVLDFVYKIAIIAFVAKVFEFIDVPERFRKKEEKKKETRSNDGEEFSSMVKNLMQGILGNVGNSNVMPTDSNKDDVEPERLPTFARRYKGKKTENREEENPLAEIMMKVLATKSSVNDNTPASSEKVEIVEGNKIEEDHAPEVEKVKETLTFE